MVVNHAVPAVKHITNSSFMSQLTSSNISSGRDCNENKLILFY